MQKPPFSVFENYSENPHSEAFTKALETLKNLANNAEIWEHPSEREGVKLSQFTKEGDLIPTVRGEGSIEGYAVEEILSVIHQPSSRAVWDVRYENGFPVVSYDRNTVGFWAAQKGTGYLVWPRDFAGILGHRQDKEEDKTISYYLQTSVDMKDVPEIPSSYVRGTLSVAGFILRDGDQPNKIDLTYIVNVDPSGSVPSSVVGMVAVEIPLCIARVRQYLADHGFPPYIPHHSERFPAIIQGEFYDHASNTLDIRWKPEGAGSFNVYYDVSRWTGGADVVPGEDTSAADFKVTESEGRVTISFEEGVKGKNLQVIVKKL